jgi:hypothetical protein
MNRVQYRVAESVPRSVRVPVGVRVASSVRVASGVRVPSGVQLPSVSAASQFQLGQSPKMALGPTLRGLKRAAEAMKFERIAGRLAALTGAGRERAVGFGRSKQARTAQFEFESE